MAAQAMPIPGTNEAPKFDGHFVADFLEDLELHFARSGVTDENVQVNWITRYCTTDIRKRIGALPELDRSKPAKTWTNATNVMKDLYGDIDRPRPLTLAEFQKWVQVQADKPAFISKAQVNAYYTEFMSKAQPLLDAKLISDNDMCFAFIQAIPTSVKPAMCSLIPDANRTRSNPSTIENTLALLHGLANKDDPTYEAWRYADASAEDALLTAPPGDSSGNSSSSQTTAATGSQPAESSKSLGDQMDSLVKSMSEMRILLTQAQVQNSLTTQQNTPPPPRSARCVMCAQQNAGHRLRACPETAKLVTEGRIRFDGSRYVMSADGSDLPRMPQGFDGGLAAYIRAQTPTPPSTHATASTMHAGLVLSDGTTFATLNLSPLVNPALRSGKDYENRFDPKKRPGSQPSARQHSREPAAQPQPSTSNTPTTAPPPQPSVPQVSQPQQPVMPPSQPPQQSTPPTQPDKATPTPPASSRPPLPSGSVPTVPEPPNPINRKDGWKQSHPKGKGKERVKFAEEDVEMGEELPPRAKSFPPSTGYRHTTELEAKTNVNDIFKTLLQEIKVSLPLSDILGLSSTLQDRMHDATHRRHVPKEAPSPATSHVLSVPHVDANGIPIIEAEYSPSGSPFRGYALHNDDFPDDQQQAAFATFALSHTKGLPSIGDHLFAMGCGKFAARINGVLFRFMVDSGSELNVAYSKLPATARLPLDYRGTNWSLRGIHGGPEQLLGYVDKVPIDLGGHVFEHHFFISPHESIGDGFELILGQPFLTYFDARIDYSPSGETVLYLWAERDKGLGLAPTLGISITDPEDVRNRHAVVMHSLLSETSSYIPPSVTTDDEDDDPLSTTSACIVEVDESAPASYAMAGPSAFC